ncbi:hypothetical protein [Neobacillus sp. OS1-33]|uniref:hypothetical protein n=1 Tax=Neobacillus sp. OS1-33 TaxID=3070683 RepID=UPI0027DF6778|nr:hypothetical protein [Neobacillus sp. OS1-33]WML24576.1 hypothetical protein RCG22_16995 [Neobacillus sp. OS1-33]
MHFNKWAVENKNILFFHFTIMIICLCVSFFIPAIITLNENQILYYFSTSAQVIAGLYGLTLTGYIFLNDRLNKIVQDDETYYDVVEELKSQQHIKIIVMGIMCIISILACFFVINTYNRFSHLNKFFNFILNQSTVMIITEIIIIVKFSWEAINPQSMSKINEKLKKDNDYFGEEEGSLADFLKYYNLLERLIIKKSNNMINDNVYKNNTRKFRPSIMESLRILSSKEIVDKELISKINELRMYRNAVVHGTEVKVSLEASKEIERLYSQLKEELENR